jgi:cell shape-determining protein MreD
MVYLLVSCGMLGIAYVVFFLLKLILYSHRLPSTDILFRCTRGWTILWLTYGLTANMIEEANVNLVIGIVFGLVFGLLYPERRGSAHPAAYGRHSERAVRGRITSSRSPSNQPGAS